MRGFSIVAIVLIPLCATAWAQHPPTQSQITFSNQGETYEQDKIWGDRIKHGACARIRDRRTDSQADIDECNRDYAMTPICFSYAGYASGWYSLANNASLNPQIDFRNVALNDINNFGSKGKPYNLPNDQLPQWREVLRHLVSVAFSSARTKWNTSNQFSDYAYKICMEGHPFGVAQRAASSDDPISAWEMLPEDPNLRETCSGTLSYATKIAALKNSEASLAPILRWAEQESERSAAYRPSDPLFPISTQLILINLIDQAYLATSVYKKIVGGFPQWAYRSCLKGQPIDGTAGD